MHAENWECNPRSSAHKSRIVKLPIRYTFVLPIKFALPLPNVLFPPLHVVFLCESNAGLVVRLHGKVMVVFAFVFSFFFSLANHCLPFIDSFVVRVQATSLKERDFKKVKENLLAPNHFLNLAKNINVNQFSIKRNKIKRMVYMLSPVRVDVRIHYRCLSLYLIISRTFYFLWLFPSDSFVFSQNVLIVISNDNHPRFCNWFSIRYALEVVCGVL